MKALEPKSWFCNLDRFLLQHGSHLTCLHFTVNSEMCVVFLLSIVHAYDPYQIKGKQFPQVAFWHVQCFPFSLPQFFQLQTEVGLESAASCSHGYNGIFLFTLHLRTVMLFNSLGHFIFNYKLWYCCLQTSSRWSEPSVLFSLGELCRHVLSAFFFLLLFWFCCYLNKHLE